MNVLLVEDEARVADFVSRGLKGDGFIVTHFDNGEQALECLDDNQFDVIVLDLMLPGISGQDVCRKIRARKNYTPILMLTALDRTDDRVEGLNLGADDYLNKPFDFDELVARLNALARRAKSFNDNDVVSGVVEHGPFTYDRASLSILKDGSEIDLTEKEREIFALFLLNPGRVIARERILNTVWGANADPLTNVVDVYIGRIRKKLGLTKDELKSLRGVGYRLTA